MAISAISQTIRYQYTPTIDEARYIKDLWHSYYKQERFYVRGHHGEHSHKTEYLVNNFFSVMNEYQEQELFFTPNSFYKPPEGRRNRLKAHLQTIYSWAIDIDYRRINPKIEPLTYFEGYIEPVLGQVIPTPNYIEYGHQLRLIYLLEEPIRLKNNRNLLGGMERIISHLSGALNDELGCNAEPQKLSSYYRVPGSINTKNGAVVHIRHITDEKYKFQELFDWLPELPEWYDKWQEKKSTVSKKGKTYKIHNDWQLHRERMKDYEKLREHPNIPRETLCFCYGCSYLFTRQPGEPVLMQKLLEFNRGFPVPLPEKEIRSKFRTLKPYKMKNETVLEKLNLTYEQAQEKGVTITMTGREKERLAKIEAGTTRKQLAEKNRMKMIELYHQGMKYQQIADELGLSLDRVKQVLGAYKKELKNN